MISELTKKQGQRLKELLKERKIKQSDIYNKYMTSYDLQTRKVYFCKYCKGEKEIPYSLLISISNELNVNIGYLIGTDNFACDSYLEFQEYDKLSDDPDFKSFNKVLKAGNLALFSSINEENNNIEYAVYSGKGSDTVCKRFNKSNLAKLCEEIKKNIIDIFNNFPDDNTSDEPKEGDPLD